MDADEEANDTEAPDEWALRTVSTLTLASRISTALFVGAVVALGLGVLGAITSYSTFGNPSTELMSMDAYTVRMAVWQSSSSLASSLLPAGVLAAAGVALRLQSARFEAEILGR